ncbi:MAG: M14 family metallopeptidase [Proteobacteria bacterium]|nr:M14 family metallopeptidase [Pseudomonadota bacterium]
MAAASSSLVDCFSRSYREAREKFLAAASRCNLAVASEINPAGLGVDGEPLATDAVEVGPSSAESVLVLTSGTHGVEGFCGSACQIALLRDDILRRRLDECGVAVLLVHALNPWGFSHSARTNEDGIDLNRNFLDFPVEASGPDGYAVLHPLLVPDHWPPSDANEAELQRRLDAGGLPMRQAMVGGQGSHPDGLFYSGAGPSWSNRTIRALLRRHGTHRKRLAWIDLHSGLGPSGHGEKIFGSTMWGPEATARALAWYGRDLVRSSSPRSVTPHTQGYIGMSAPRECPQAEYTFMTLEFGTVPFDEATRALRGEIWLRSHPDAASDLRQSIRTAVRRSFYVEEDFWKGQVLGQFRSVALQAVHGLSTLA